MKKIHQIIDYFKNIDPCSEESICLVRPACYMLHSTPWVRTQKCPDYKTYQERRDKFEQIKTEIIDWFWVIAMISSFLFILSIFGLGIWKLVELLKGWL